MKSKTNLIIVLGIALLSGCSSGHSFKKGDQVFAFPSSEFVAGYCEGSVVSDKDGQVIVNVQGCKNGGIQGVTDTGMNSFDAKDVYGPTKGLVIAKARSKFFDVSESGSFSSYTYISAPNEYTPSIATIKKKMKQSVAAKLPGWTTYLNYLAVFDPIYNYSNKINGETSAANRGPNQAKLAAYFAKHVDDIETANNKLIDYLSSSKGKSVRDRMVSMLNINMTALVQFYTGFGFDPAHPAIWKAADTKALNTSNALMANYVGELKSAKFAVPEFFTKAIADNKGVAKRISADYDSGVVNKAMKFSAADNINKNISNKDFLAKVQNQLEPMHFTQGVPQAMAKVKKLLIKGRGTDQMIAKVKRDMIQGKGWYAYIKIGYSTNYKLFIKFVPFAHGMYASWVNASQMGHTKPNKWSVDVDRNGNITINSGNGLYGRKMLIKAGDLGKTTIAAKPKNNWQYTAYKLVLVPGKTKHTAKVKT